MKLERDILIVAIVCHLQPTTEAEKSADTETPYTYDKNLIQVVDDSVISRFSRELHYGSFHLGCLFEVFFYIIL